MFPAAAAAAAMDPGGRRMLGGMGRSMARESRGSGVLRSLPFLRWQLLKEINEDETKFESFSNRVLTYSQMVAYFEVYLEEKMMKEG